MSCQVRVDFVDPFPSPTALMGTILDNTLSVIRRGHVHIDPSSLGLSSR